MTEITIKLPDVGEGVAEAELVEWSVRVGDAVREDDVLAAVMTDKATVEIPSPVTGVVSWLGGEIGERLAVGGPLARISVEAATDAEPIPTPPSTDLAMNIADAGVDRSTEVVTRPSENAYGEQAASSISSMEPTVSKADRHAGEGPLASPSVRLRAKTAGVDLASVRGSGPAGRITHEDLDASVAFGRRPVQAPEPEDTVREIKVVGLRRKIAERMAEAKRRIPHITIIEEIDVTALEDLREKLNFERLEGRPKLTILPFLMAAMVRAVQEHPEMNAHFDDESEVVRRHSAVHIGIATQTKAGLTVPVVRHCERLTLWRLAEDLGQAAEAARTGSATREQLAGSTITISSLGPLGAIATTPIINRPEVAIIGVNRMAIRPKWDGATFIPRKMMNLSSSFDHRVIDGWDAAVFVKRLKALLETPPLIFVEQ